MRSFEFITPRGDGKIERSWQCDRICYFTIGWKKGVTFTEQLCQISDVYDELFGVALLMMELMWRRSPVEYQSN
ncbi:MAG: hypothetical protein V7K26_14255 [Nostoc sp.]|uniref:hypothetical protein n=1 Tax=Nostoc sp. TaxID=1180 RepID=UPI002FEFE2E2